MARMRLAAARTVLLLLTLCPPLFAQERAWIIVPPRNLSLDRTALTDEQNAAGARFAALLGDELGKEARIAGSDAEAYPEDPLDRRAVARFALAAGGDAAVSGWFLLEPRGDGRLFGRMTLFIADLTDPDSGFTRSREALFPADQLEARLAGAAEQTAAELRTAIPPLTREREDSLERELSEAVSELRARRTVTLTLAGRPDPDVRLVLPDGSSPGSFASGEVVLEVPSESLFRVRLEKEGHYTRVLEKYVERNDVRIDVPYIYPVHGWDLGFSHSYLRPFGLLGEARLRLFDERAVAGTSLGAFLLPDYTDGANPEPDFSRLMVEGELGFQLGWYIFSPPDAVLRLLLEANTRINTYTMTNQGGRTFLALMSGPGLRLEANQLNWILHAGVRGYFPHLTPSNEREGGVVLINGGLTWKF